MRKDKKYYGYECFTGCGHNTLTDKRYKQKRTHCAVCGFKTEMVFLGEFTIERIPSLLEGSINLGLSK